MEEKIREYAHLLVNIGLNVQKGQRVNIRASVECADFVRLCVEEAYKAGASDVTVDWHDDAVSKMEFLNADDNVFDVFPQWHVDKLEEMDDNNTAVLNIYAEDPNSLEGVSSDRIQRYAKARGAALKKHYEKQMANAFPWCIGSVPIKSWAKKVFPDANDNEAINKMWDAILKTVYVSGKNNSVALWQEHIKKTAELCDKLNQYNFKSLHYLNSAGTDLIVELPEDHIWMGGAEKTKSGVDFVANMPTEEIFTAPKKDGVNGTIAASKPLCLDGNVVNGIKFTVENGKIIKATADTAEDVLLNALSVDEGASYFGEIALVPYNSPISNLNILFYNTLFDENASCHIAFGEAYPSCIKGGSDMSREELDKRGLNYSIMHEDFMVGTADLSIVGTTHDGKEIQVFKNGNFAI